ncbi:MAG: M1 family aminopeptidase [Ekhidna sp.]
MTYQIFIREFNSWLRKPIFYCYLFVFCTIGFLAFAGSAGLFDPPSKDTTLHFLNSPFEINFIFQYFNKFLLFLVPAICGSAIYRDFRSNAHSILYSYPVSKYQYLAGKFLGSFLALNLIALGLAVSIGIAEQIPGLHAHKVGPFQLAGYLQVYFLYTLPNLFYISIAVFLLVAYTRNIFVGFGTIIILFFVQIIAENAFSGNGVLIALFDPFGQNTIGYETQLWSLGQRNTDALPVTTTIIFNRLIWCATGIFLGYLLLRRFDLQEHAKLPSWNTFIRKEKENGRINYDSEPSLIIPSYNRKRVLYAAKRMLLFDLKFIIKHWMFVIFVLLGLLAVLFAIGRVTNGDGFTLLPTTRLVLSVPAYFFSGVATMITFIYSGMIIHRNRSTGIDPLIDVTPLPNSTFLLSKVLTVVLMQGILLGILIVSGVVIQLYNGYYRFELDIYFFQLLLLVYPILMLWAFLSVFVHNLFSNLYVGFFILLLGWIGMPGLGQIGLDTRLLNFYTDEIIVGSDFSGYLFDVNAYIITKGYWLNIGVLLVIVTFLLWVRGSDNVFKQRLKNAASLITLPVLSGIGLVVISASIFGFKIYQGEQEGSDFANKSRGKMAAFQEKFSKYENEPQPKITDIQLEIDLYPQSQSFAAYGKYVLINKSHQQVDKLLIKTGFDEQTIILNDNLLTLIEEDSFMKFKAFRLAKVLAPGDSIELKFKVESIPNSLFERNSGVLKNGTFLRDDILPRIGYTGGKEKQLPGDSISRVFNYQSRDTDYVNFNCTISTSKDQLAVTPGDLVSEWSMDDRNYFRYKTSTPVKFGFGFQSGKWVSTKEIYNGINLEVLSHPDHQQNADNMISGLREAIAYNAKYFSPYQHSEAKIIEFPNSEGSYATTFSNTMPTSEQRFIAKVDTSTSIDIAFYVSAHELTHQWWANQLIPANAKGALMLTESITEYISLDIYRKTYGEEKAFDFLKQQRMRYLRGRTSEAGVEPPLSLVEDQQYIAYGKGAMVFNALQHYLGKETLNGVLRDFLRENAFKGSPYPTSKDLVGKLQDAVPDSLKSYISNLFNSVTLQTNVLKKASIFRTSDQLYKLELSIDHSTETLKPKGKSKTGYDYLEVGLYNQDEQLIATKNVRLREGLNTLSLSSKEMISSVALDPNLLTIEKNLDDNTLKVQEK